MKENEEEGAGVRRRWLTNRMTGLRPLEYLAVKELLTEIGRALPELDGVVPCYVQSDHMNQLGALQCFWSVTRMTMKTGN